MTDFLPEFIGLSLTSATLIVRVTVALLGIGPPSDTSKGTRISLFSSRSSAFKVVIVPSPLPPHRAG